MIDEKYNKLVTAYLQDSLTSDERTKLNTLIGQGEIDIIDLKEMEALYRKTGEISIPEPSEAMRSNFYRMLEEEKDQRQPAFTEKVTRLWTDVRTRVEWRQLAGIAAVFVFGLLIGNLATPFKNYNQQLDHLSNEVTQMRQVVALNLMNDSSPTERLKAVNISMELQSDDYKVIQSLLKTLNNDSNVNVRLAAVEALIRHGDSPTVRQGLVRSINKQESPLVQAALADAMLALQETDSVQELRKLLHKDDLDGSVRKKLQNTIAVLS